MATICQKGKSNDFWCGPNEFLPTPLRKTDPMSAAIVYNSWVSYSDNIWGNNVMHYASMAGSGVLLKAGHVEEVKDSEPRINWSSLVALCTPPSYLGSRGPFAKIGITPVNIVLGFTFFMWKQTI